MGREPRCLSVSIATDLALELLDAQMQMLVMVESFGAREGGLAVIALVRPLRGVHGLVLIEQRFRSETACASLTLERLFARVRAPMYNECIAVARAVAAKLTHVVAFCAVDATMRRQIVLANKGLAATLMLAFELPQTRVGLHMAQKSA